MHIFGQKCLAPPKLTELLRLWLHRIAWSCVSKWLSPYFPWCWQRSHCLPQIYDFCVLQGSVVCGNTYQVRWEMNISCKFQTFCHLPCQKFIKIGGNLPKFWQKQICTVFWDTVYINYNGSEMVHAHAWCKNSMIFIWFFHKNKAMVNNISLCERWDDNDNVYFTLATSDSRIGKYKTENN